MDGDVVWNMIDHFNYQSVAFSSNNSRPGELPIDCYHTLCVAQSGHVFQPYLKRNKREKKKKKTATKMIINEVRQLVLDECINVVS